MLSLPKFSKVIVCLELKDSNFGIWYYSHFCYKYLLHSGSRRGKTGRIRFPNAESWVMKYPDECACACCKAAFCWAAICCCSAWSRKSLLREDLESEILAPGWFVEDWFCISNFLFSLSSSAKIATLFLFWKHFTGLRYQRVKLRTGKVVGNHDWDLKGKGKQV